MANCWCCKHIEHKYDTCKSLCCEGDYYRFSFKRWIKARLFYLWEDIKLVVKAIMEEYFG
jgi:hypothetical protein